MNTALPLELTEVIKVYGRPPSQVLAVNGITFRMAEGEIVVVIGPSGSGKTTFLSIAGCLMKPTSGSVRVMGQEVTSLTERELPRVRLKHVGFVFQSFNLLEPLTAEENVVIAMNLAGRQGHAARSRAREILDELGLLDRASRRPNELSAGEQQRVAIARALANRPDVLLADEPTANLDSRTGQRVMAMLASAIKREEAKGLVVVTHDTRVLEFADRVLWMEDGRIFDNTPASAASDEVVASANK